MDHADQYLPQGALRQPDGSVVWRTWAPLCNSLALVTFNPSGRRAFAMTPEGRGFFAHQQAEVEEGLSYLFRLPDGREYPDPASRWQPQGVHRPSAVFFPGDYRWSDDAWRGIAREDLVIYELHVGAFTPEGTFDAIVPRLSELLALGVTAIELMPVAQFAGERNWGYDGVYPYAVQSSYGGPRGLQQLVDAAHRAGLAVLLDAVYNHFGCEGNYCGNFGPYLTDRYRTPWAAAVNYDGPDSDAVRQFALDNARMWVRDYHVDGLRLDAVHAIFDLGARNVLAELQEAVQQEAARARRSVHAIAESDQNDVRLVQPPEYGGHGLDAVWADDFHHSVHALLTGERDGYYADFGRAEHLAKAFNDVFVYDGCYSEFRRRRHGSPTGAIDRTQFVVCIQNHDQVGNRARGDRFGSLLPAPAHRLACGLLLLSPCVPLLFMGEEYGEQRPFPFFCSFADPAIIEAVERGRRREFADLGLGKGVSHPLCGAPEGPFRQTVADTLSQPDPQDSRTFAAAKLAWAWPAGSPQAHLRQLYQDLLLARRRWPALRDRRQTTARVLTAAGPQDSAVGPCLLAVERGGAAGILALANLSGTAQAIAGIDLHGRELLLSTEDPRYGGCRRGDHSLQGILAYELLIFGGQGTRPLTAD